MIRETQNLCQRGKTVKHKKRKGEKKLENMTVNKQNSVRYSDRLRNEKPIINNSTRPEANLIRSHE